MRHGSVSKALWQDTQENVKQTMNLQQQQWHVCGLVAYSNNKTNDGRGRSSSDSAHGGISCVSAMNHSEQTADN